MARSTVAVAFLSLHYPCYSCYCYIYCSLLLLITSIIIITTTVAITFASLFPISMPPLVPRASVVEAGCLELRPEWRFGVTRPSALNLNPKYRL